MSATSIILKTDKRGHVRMPPERREALLAEYDRSGLSLARFTEQATFRLPAKAGVWAVGWVCLAGCSA